MSIGLPSYAREPGPRLLTWGMVGAALLFAAGLVLAPDQVWRAWMVAALFVLLTGTGALALLAILHITSGHWAAALRRPLEAMTAALPLGSGMFVLVLFGANSLFPWTHAGIEHEIHAVALRGNWHSLGFFALRAGGLLGLWLLLRRWMLSASRKQDRAGGIASVLRNKRIAAITLVLLAPTFSLAAFDWIMGLDPGWYSTVFAFYVFSGVLVGTVAAAVLFILWLRRSGLTPWINESHLRDLGKMLFAFSSFWAYLWFCQYLLVWYSNIPEEVTWYLPRHAGAWGIVTLVSLGLNWGVPFVFLMAAPMKGSARALGWVAALVLAGRWMDLMLMVGPGEAGGGPALGFWEAGILGGAVCAMLFVVRRALDAAPLKPEGDPYLPASLHHHGA